MKIDRTPYYDYEQLKKVIEELAHKFPNLIELSSIGQSREGREIWLLTITDFADHLPSERPAVWVDGNTHASELAGCQASVHLAQLLTDGFGTSSRISELLKTTTFYIVPRISVDGAEHVLKTGAILRSSPEVFPGDQPFENFTQRDLDGDGEVLSMRVPDPAGLFKICPEDPRLMVLREPQDFSQTQGPYFNIYPEGEFNNYDGFTRPILHPQRYDLNRQAPAQFSPKEGGAGPIPMYLPEAKALAQAVVDRSNIAVCVTYHTYGGFLLRPSSVVADSEMPTLDLTIFETMGRLGQKITGYPPLAVFHDFNYDPKQPTTGAWDDWHFHHRGVFSWTPEIWSLTRQVGLEFEKPLKAYQDYGSENLVKILKWCETNLPPDSYYKNWTKFDHPQLGAVEIGGWRTLFTFRNPPAKFLSSEIARLSEFVLTLSQMVARLTIRDVRIKSFAKDVFRVELAVSNQGFLPTHVSETAEALKVYPKPLATLKLAAGQSLVQGKLETSIRHLKGRAQSLPWLSSVLGLDSQNVHEDLLVWTIQGKGPVEIELKYHGAGLIRHVVELA